MNSSISITHVVLVGLVLQCLIPASSAQLTISTTSSTPCYGDVVTLVCHHPELATNTQTQKYLSTPTWKENGVVITPAVGTVFTDETAQDLMSTTLNITITVDHFRNRSFYYSCFLVLAGASAGQLEVSQNVTVDPIAQPGPPLVTMAATDSSITLTWNTTLHCFETEIFTLIVNWNEIRSGINSSTTVLSSPYTISGLQPGTSYEVSVHGVSGSGVVSERRVSTVTTTDASPTRDIPSVHPTTIAVAASVPVVVVVILIAVISVVISCSVLLFRKRGSTNQTYELHDVQELQEPSPASREPSPTNQFRTNYAELTFEGVQPIKPPPLECEVTYTEPLAPGERMSITEPVEDEVMIDSREETPLLESFDHALNRDEATPDDQSTIPITESSSVDHLPTQPPADPFRSVPDAENDLDKSAAQSQFSSDSAFICTFDPTGHEEEDFVLPQESNQPGTPVETSDPAHDSLDPLPPPGVADPISEKVEEEIVTPLEETPLQPTDTLCVGFDWMYSLPVTKSGYGRFVSGFLKNKSEPLTEAGQYKHLLPREPDGLPCTALRYVKKRNHHLRLQSIPHHMSVHWAAFLLLAAIHLSGAKFNKLQ